jgi:hypothetical protein
LDDEARELLGQHHRAESRQESEELFDKYLAKVREANRVLGVYEKIQYRLFGGI